MQQFKISKTTGLLCMARHHIPLGILRSLYHFLAYPYLYYGNICWGSTYSTRLDSIRKIQKEIRRSIMFGEYKEHTTPLFIRLLMLQLDDINLQVTALFMFRFFNNMLMIHLMITLC